MSMKWSIDRIKDYPTKSWRSEVDGGFRLQWLRKHVYLAQTLKRERERERESYLTVE